MKPRRVRRWPWPRRRHVGFALMIGLLGLAAWINLPLVSTLFDQSADAVAALPAVPPFTPGQRVLVRPLTRTMRRCAAAA